MSTSRAPLKIVLASWAPFVGGAEIAAERLALGLTAAGHHVLVVLGAAGAALERIREAGLRCEYLPMHLTDKWRWWRHAAAQARFRKLLERHQPDVVHFNDLPTSQMLGKAAGELGVPRICHHRWIFEGEAIDWLNKFGAERHLFVSHALMEDLCGKSAALAACPRAVVHDGLPLPPCPAPEDRPTARRELELPLDRLILLFAGQIIERKGIADAIRAFAALQRWHDRAALWIVGDDLENDGDYRRTMESLAHETDSPARFVGFQKNVDRWLAASDAVLVPSHAEPLGNATLEAMAAARPVIGTRVGGIPEMVVDGETGLLVPPHSPAELAVAMERLLMDMKLRERMGIAGRQRCETHFSLEAHTEAILRQYDAVLEHAGVNA